MNIIAKKKKTSLYSVKTAQALQNVDIKSLIASEKSFYYLKKKQLNNAVNNFSSALDSLSVTEYNKKIWDDTFLILSQYYLNNNLPENTNDFSYKKINKILVSGMGWSGSGAVYDYLSEFEEISGINSELSFISHGTSLYKIEKHIHKSQFKETLLDFFKYTLYSNVVPLKTSHAKSISNNIFFSGDKDGNYSNAVNILIKELISFNSNNKNKRNIFYKLTSKFVDNIFSSSLTGNKKYLLLNNVIKIQKIDAIKYLNNYKIFCTFRDPRSTYISQYYENKKLFNIDDFVKKYKQARKNYKNKIKKYHNHDIYEIQFEDFVMNEKYRAEIAKTIGLNIENKLEKSKFNPDESQKNVFNYKDFRDQNAIKKIEKKLSEYLWEKQV